MKAVVRHAVLILCLMFCLRSAMASAEGGGFTLPAQTERIEDGAFEGVPISDLWLTDDVKSIGSRAFANTGMTTVVMPAGVRYIAPDAFNGCTGMVAAVHAGSYAAQWCADNGVTALTITGLGTESRTQQQIRDFVNAHPADTQSSVTYRRAPSLAEPYSPGLMSMESLQNGLNMVNQVRYIAGLNADVVNADDVEENVAAAALINCLNDEQSHTPSRPAVLADSAYDDLYQKAYSGASSSNLYAGMRNMANAVLGYMNDSDNSNISRVGHRRWILNPPMGRTTFGYCDSRNTRYGSFSGMYAFDRSSSGRQAPVAWPSVQMPMSHFIRANTQAWSVSFNRMLDVSAIRVTLIRDSDHYAWHFSDNDADGDFYVNNNWYGQPGCVIFRAATLSSISAGDSFHVLITDTANGTALIYTVAFFTV